MILMSASVVMIHSNTVQHIGQGLFYVGPGDNRAIDRVRLVRYDGYNRKRVARD